MPQQLNSMISLTLFLIIVATSTADITCDPVEIKFTTTSLSVSEGSTLDISLQLTSPRHFEGEIKAMIGLSDYQGSTEHQAKLLDWNTGEGKLIFNMEDWNASTFNLTIKSGTSESSKHSIIILSNNRYEGNKKFYLEILQIATPPSLKGCVVKGNPSRLPVVVQDDDTIEVRFSNKTLSTIEGKVVSIGVELSGAIFTKNLRFNIFCFEAEFTNQADGLFSATANVDFLAMEDYGVEFVADGAIHDEPLRQVVHVHTILDEDPEPPESFVCQFRHFSTEKDSLHIIEPHQVLITIIDKQD